MGGVLQIEVRDLSELPDAVLKLAQACMRVADLTFTRRSSLQSPVREVIEEVLADCELEYTTDVELTGRSGRKIPVDFLVRGVTTTSALMTLASGNASQAHVISNEIFAKWYDLSTPDRTEQRVTVFDDAVNVYRDSDLERLRDLSTVLGLGDRETLRATLAA